MGASISTSTNVFIIGTSIVVPVDIQSSEIAYDPFNNAFIMEGTVIAFGTVQSQITKTVPVTIQNTPTVLATIEGQPIQVNVTNTPTVLATIKGQPVQVNVTNTPTVLATIEGQPIQVNVTNTPNVIASVTNTVPVTVQNTVTTTIASQPISVTTYETLATQVINVVATQGVNIFPGNIIAPHTGVMKTEIVSYSAGTITTIINGITGYLNAGNPINPYSWYEFTMDVVQSDTINVQFIPTATVNVRVLFE